MQTHRLKCWPQYFTRVLAGQKNFEIRYNDRDFKLHDRLELCEFEPCQICKGKGSGVARSVSDRAYPLVCSDCGGKGGTYTGREVKVVVRYVLSEHEGLRSDYVIMGIREAPIDETVKDVVTTAKHGNNAVTRAMMVAGLRTMADAIEAGAKHMDGGGTMTQPKPGLLNLNMNLTVSLPDGPRIVRAN